MRNGPFALLFNVLVVAFMLAPLLVVCLVAFTPTDTLSVPWGAYSLRWFRAVFEHGDLVQSFWNSLAVGLLAATGAVLLAVPAGLAIARHDFPGRQALNGLLMSPLIVPHLVLGVAMLRLFALLGARGSSLWLTLAHVVIVLPYALRLIVAALAGADRSIEQAALSLGASRFTTFRRVTLPLIAPGVLAGAMLAFTLSLDDFIITFFTTGPGATTLPIYVYGLLRRIVTPEVNALSTIWILVVLVAVAISQWFQNRD